ncbi:zinc ABC transporter substrate-binding protein [Bifidobacterium amazonense]|uniref:Zinc ABC transporter substrate-binding protein n=1 Tax=Bifidobacterium amazonense TaxID=2809027 RepID=A0ABS9VU64_9BIFI|nr:zinc ABC transporter substrate-binding protein [Bifidobacterium amazonense]MCH9275633.1 zinc ABC transporter substrate-binding protein [Bifidobacterium amazonense]
MNIRGSRIGRAVAGVFAAMMLMAAAGCGTSNAATQTEPQQQEQTGPIEVVASINQWGSLAEQIGGDDVSVTSILSSTGVDAHDFEPKTSDVAKLSKATIVVANGAGYDTWATKNVGKDAVIVSAAQTVGAMEGDNPHLWFSKDARNGMAQELVNAFSKALPGKKKDFTKRYKEWQEQEKTVEEKMKEFSSANADATYAATEAVAYYLMSDMGFEDKTPKGYAASAAAEGEAAPADLQEFQKLLESRDVDLLVNNTQEASDATNMITGTAERSDVPIVDVSEQMPSDAASLTDWIGDLVDSVAGHFATDCSDASSDSSDAKTGDGTNDVASCPATTDDSGSSSDGSADGSTDGSSDDESTESTPSNAGQTDPGK